MTLVRYIAPRSAWCVPRGVKNLGYKRIMITLSDVPDDVLVDRLLNIRKHERSLLVELLHYLGELDRRRAVLALGYPSLFSFCVDALGLTKAAAFRRTTAARLMARFPLVADYLMDGRLNLTTLGELRDILDESHLVEILDRAAGRTEDQVKELVAKLRPQPAPADLLRKLPTHRNDCSGSGPAPATTAQLAPPQPATSPPLAPTLPPLAAAPPAPARAASEERLQPIAAERHVLRVTVTRSRARPRCGPPAQPFGEIAIHSSLRKRVAGPSSASTAARLVRCSRPPWLAR